MAPCPRLCSARYAGHNQSKTEPMPSNDARNAWKKGQPLDKAVTQQQQSKGKTQKKKKYKK